MRPAACRRLGCPLCTSITWQWERRGRCTKAYLGCSDGCSISGGGGTGLRGAARSCAPKRSSEQQPEAVDRLSLCRVVAHNPTAVLAVGQWQRRHAIPSAAAATNYLVHRRQYAYCRRMEPVVEKRVGSIRCAAVNRLLDRLGTYRSARDSEVQMWQECHCERHAERLLFCDERKDIRTIGDWLVAHMQRRNSKHRCKPHCAGSTRPIGSGLQEFAEGCSNPNARKTRPRVKGESAKFR